MKRLICVLLLVVVMVSMLSACAKFTCDMCGEEKSGGKHEETVLGSTVEICDDCYKGLNDLANAFK